MNYQLQDIEPILGPIPNHVHKKFKYYNGDQKSFQLNMDYLQDPKKIYENHPDKEFIDKHWDSLPDDAYAEFACAFTEEYKELFERYAALGKMDIQVNMGATTGEIWKFFGFPKKKFCYKHPAWPLWLKWYEDKGCFFNWVEPYCIALKGENTDQESIDKHKSRVFYMAGPMTDYLGKTLCQNFNKALQDTSWCSIGTVWQYGGIDEMIDDMNRHKANHPKDKFLMKDGQKFDMTRKKRHFALDSAVRCQFPVYGIEHYREKIMWLFRQALYKFLILPFSHPRKWFWSGGDFELNTTWFITNVLVLEWVQPSGNFETSEGNSFDNFFDHWVHFCYFGGMNMTDMIRRVYFNIYSDDDLLVVPPEFCDYRAWLKTYAACGRILKPYEVPPDDTLIGKTFCGIHFTPKGYVIAKDKCYYSANVVGKLTPREYKEKLYSLAANLAGDEEEFDKFVKYVTPQAEKITGPLNFERSKLVGTGRLFLPLF